MTDRRVSIIIPHRNQPGQLEKCLNRLMELGYGSQEIIVVDNGSAEVPGFLEKYRVKLLTTDPIPSPYVARNVGISYAACKIMVLLDVNAVVEPYWLENALSLLRKDMILGGVVARPDPAELDVFQRFDYLHSVLYPKDENAIHALPAGNLFFYKSVWDKVGPFREVRSLGDMEWTSRARKLGVTLMVDPGVRFQYPFKTGKAFTSKYRRLGAGHVENDFHRNPVWYVIKNFLPPSPGFVKSMQERNRRERMNLTGLQIFFQCYRVKINYGIGALRRYMG